MHCFRGEGMKKNKLKDKVIFEHIVLILLSLICIIPFLLVLSISFSNEVDVAKNGYSLIPRIFDLKAYEYVFSNSSQVVRSYIITISSAFIGTFLSVIVMSLYAYPLSRRNFRQKKFFSFYIFFTMLFSGGLVPSYILITRYLHLGNSFWVLVIPGLVVPFHVFMLRTFFQQIPESVIESAKIDGCNSWTILFKIVFPQAIPALATVSLMGILSRWNDWYTCLLYINDDNLLTLQYLLQRIMMNVEMMKSNMLNIPEGLTKTALPTETMRMAMAVVTTGPIVFIFPFFQKYFVSGLTVGAVKG